MIDIGWCDGVLSDGRPFRAETWAQDGVTMLTIYFSNVGIEELDNDALCKFIQAEDLVAFVDDDPKHINARKWTNDEGNEFWSVNILIGYDEHTFLSGSVPVFPYSRSGEPNAMLNDHPISAAHSKRASGPEN